MDKIVFTNGCFDIIHPGHIDLLGRARSLGTHLIVGLNSDRSVLEIKGAPRPLMDENSRAAVLRALRAVDEVLIFDENTPERLIKEIKPDVLVKGGDWQPEQIIGADFVIENGGEVFSIPFERDISTSKIVGKIPAAKKRRAGCSHAPEAETDISRVFDRREQAIIERGAKIISGVLAAGGSVHIFGAGQDRRGVQRLSEDLSACFGAGRIARTDFSAIGNSSFRTGDLLIAVGDGEEFKKTAEVIMNGRRAGCKIIVLTGKEGKKLAGLGDLCLLLDAESPPSILWRQSTVGAFWCRAVKL